MIRSRDTSRIPELRRLEPGERRRLIAQRCGIGTAALDEGLALELADLMVENAIGSIGVPLGVATNFTVNGQDILVPLATEEPSVIAAASNGARMARAGGGFVAEVDPPLTCAQIEILDPETGAPERLAEAADEILALANGVQPELVGVGGGARELDIRPAVGGEQRLVVHLVVDCRDAMGANSVNTMAEAVSARVVALTGGRPGLRIVTNLADRRLARASCEVPFEALARKGYQGADVAQGVVSASRFASDDPYRAATHNKGIFNGIDALLLATGNDWRAVEAGGHAYAARSGRYGPLAIWESGTQGRLQGRIELPVAVGIVGGAARINPVARLCIELLGLESAGELAQVTAAVGLSCNLAALAALSAEGIQKGHMALQRRKDDD